MGTGTEKGTPRLLRDGTDEDVDAFITKWKLDKDTGKRLRSAVESKFTGGHFSGIDDVDTFANDFGISEEGRRALHKAYDAELAKGLPPAPPPPPDFTDELLVKSRMEEGRRTRTAQGLSSTFLTGKTKVGQ